MVILLEVILRDGIIRPEQLPDLLQRVTEKVPAGGTEVVSISGRLPVWAFAALVHLFHPRPVVGTFDPRLGGAVVVATHDARWRVGDLIPLEGETVTIEF